MLYCRSKQFTTKLGPQNKKHVYFLLLKNLIKKKRLLVTEVTNWDYSLVFNAQYNSDYQTVIPFKFCF